ncbi:MAG: hypothetical protein COZ06_37245 [Armatimonadetes bacterium CG_4_10_14_3_um_filter_66_18]|nr:hypothetical protein [Armatimonadota bacterium]OIP07779.1 MAG: hypothetical protein AUJ96_06840 [Armatimonadetes bacterium CG2_30_66_41]PIU95217.1 MAG: hypothetical protein COS65_03565 [Armatimonadetes bacterium CG06_land_8_20_14_3_00_66_21]PIX47749.1 MAG: hypothetical protein COZ57_07595 [Armatimonadetes bacterium CG_4_8_14_3_um_filter_66_20]PIY35957.1 MAG: hypothetical protein COZ06_37245 [Armatimonadetes bacterium CG_4_10_14_3_um_filter_66_18]PIZ50524.1 MAG: hypothetical protein COY42_01
MQFDGERIEEEREIALSCWDSYPDARVVPLLAAYAQRRLYGGDKEAIYALKALLDYDSVEVRSAALVPLLHATTPELAPKDDRGLSPPNCDATLIEGAKANWLAWWKENEQTFRPQKYGFSDAG